MKIIDSLVTKVKGVEQVHRRTEFSKIYEEESGLFTLVSSLQPLHFLAEGSSRNPSAKKLEDVDPESSIETTDYVEYDKMPIIVRLFKNKSGYEVTSRKTGHRITAELIEVDHQPKTKLDDSGDFAFIHDIQPDSIRLWKHAKTGKAPKHMKWKITESGKASGEGSLHFSEEVEAFDESVDIKKPVAKDINKIAISTMKTGIDANSFYWEETLPKSNIKVDLDVSYQSTSAGSVLNDDTTFAASRGATDGDSVDTGNFPYGPEMSHFGSARRIIRLFTPFDTSSLPNNAVVSSAIYSVYVYSKTNDANDGTDYLSVIQTSQATPASLAIADFDQAGSTKGATDVDLTGITTGQYLDFSLNATGIGWINLTGNTLLGLREGHDLNNFDIGTGDNTGNGIRLQNSNGTPPKLVVTFTATNTGYKTPRYSGSPRGEFTNPTNIYSSDNSYATSNPTDTANDEQDYHGFSFPELLKLNATDIAQIEVVIEAKANQYPGQYTTVSLSHNGGTNFTSIKYFPNDVDDWTLSDTTASSSTTSLTGLNPLWGRTWSISEFSKDNFRVRLNSIRYAGTGTLISYDQLLVRIFYVGSDKKTKDMIGSGFVPSKRR